MLLLIQKRTLQVFLTLQLPFVIFCNNAISVVTNAGFVPYHSHSSPPRIRLGTSHNSAMEFNETSNLVKHYGLNLHHIDINNFPKARKIKSGNGSLKILPNQLTNNLGLFYSPGKSIKYFNRRYTLNNGDKIHHSWISHGMKDNLLKDMDNQSETPLDKDLRLLKNHLNGKQVKQPHNRFKRKERERIYEKFIYNPEYMSFSKRNCCHSVMQNDDPDESPYLKKEKDPRQNGLPYFDAKSPKEIKVAVGTTAHIPCMARNTGKKMVSWIRSRDVHVLTVGTFSFTTDERFSAHRDTITKDWVLIIQHTATADSGMYECSVPTKPVTSHTVSLQVLVPRTELLGTSEVHLERGSSLNLTCLVHDSPTPPEFILWYHKDKLVNYGSSTGNISSGSSNSPAVRDRVMVQTFHHSDTSQSSLLVKNATTRDSGRYHCKPSNAPRAVALVHVIPSEDPAAMQTTNRGSFKNCCAATLQTIIFIILIILTPLLTDVTFSQQQMCGCTSCGKNKKNETSSQYGDVKPKFASRKIIMRRTESWLIAEYCIAVNTGQFLIRQRSSKCWRNGTVTLNYVETLLILSHYAHVITVAFCNLPQEVVTVPKIFHDTRSRSIEHI